MEDRYLNIATTDNGPLSIDRLLYVALKNIDYDVTFTCPVVAEGYTSANDGTRDGVIAAFPDLGEVYKNLIQVPVALEQINVLVFARNGTDMSINSWDELDGLKVGILTNRTYILEKLPKNVTIIAKETSKVVLDGLVQGEYDVAVLVERTHETLSQKSGVTCIGQIDQLTEYLYLNKKHERLVPELAEELRGMFDDGRADKILNDIPIDEVNKRKTIVHIISSNTDMIREDQFSAALRKQFENKSEIEWYTVSLSSRRFSRDPNRLSSIASYLRQDCVSRNVAAVIVSGNDALEFLINHYYLYFRNVPVFFYGVNGQYQAIIQDYEEYFIGVVENLEAYETARTALTLFPNTKKIYVINDYTAEGLRYRNIMEDQLKRLGDSVSIEYNQEMDRDSLLTYIEGLPEDSFLLFGSYFVDSNGQYYSLNEMKRLLGKNCAIPIFSLYSTDIEYNAVGGKCLDYTKYGEIIADMLQKSLDGTSPMDIPVIADSTEYNRWVFDKNELDKFGIDENDLPAGAQVNNKMPTIWEADPRFAVTVLLLLAVSIAAVVGMGALVMNKRKHKMQIINEAKLREVKERLERIINTAPILFMLTIDGTVIDINETMSKNTGLNIGDETLPLFAVREHRDRVVSQAAQDNFVTNEIMNIKLANGEVHRAIANIATVEYGQQTATVVWAVDIEQSEKQKDQLQNARQNLQTILDMIPGSVRIAEKETARILYANNACLKMYGFDNLDQLCKCTVYDIIPDVQSDGIDSREKIKNLLESDDLVSMEVEYFDSMRNVIYTRVTICSIDYNGIPSRLAVITDLARERELEEMRHNLQTVLDMLPIAVRVVDSHTKLVTYVNKAATDIFGMAAPVNAIGRHSLFFLPETQPNGVISAEMLKKNPLTVPTTTSVTFRKENGELFDALITSISIDYNGTESSLGIIQDLTLEKEYQKMLANTAEKEKEANTLKSRFLVNMSHEIRTPMNAIIGLTDIELHSNSPKEPNEVYKKINISAKNLLAIINEILDLSKIEADKIELFEDEFELEEVINSALLVTTPRLEGKNVEFMLSGTLDLPRCVIGDRTRLWQILKNFLDNSAKFTDNGKIVLTVFIDHERSDNETVAITFIVEDTGIGMNDEQLERVFLPYQQVYSDAQKRYSGTGLGMPISKQLCELMGGTLKMKSEIGKGTSICMSIPFKRSLSGGMEQWTKKSPELFGINVLAVDDDRLTLDIIEGLLTSNHANCTTAQSGMEAIDIIIEKRDKGEAFDIILLDYMMEGMNGLETAKQIQSVLSKAPGLLMVTAYQEFLVKDKLHENGIAGVIEKPFIPSHFINKICVALGLKCDDAEEASVVYTKFQNVNVLLCEDYRMNQEVAVDMLAQFGIDTTIAENGKEAVELFNKDNTFDLIFMDLHMPIMDGYEATRIIRANPAFDRIPIIGLTADAMKEVVDNCLKIGMNDHLAKPIEYDSLYNILLKWIPKDKRVAGDEFLKPTDPQKEALMRFGNDEGRYNDALLEFSHMLPDAWREFDDAINEMEETRNFVHKLKGAAGTLSENDIYQCAAEFEASLRDIPDANLYHRLINVCGAVKQRIQEQNGTLAANLADGTDAELKELLTALKEGLNEYDPETIAPVIHLLKSKAWPSVDEQKLDQLYAYTGTFEYESALGVLEKIMISVDAFNME